MLEYALENVVATRLVARKQRLVDFIRARGFDIRTSLQAGVALL